MSATQQTPNLPIEPAVPEEPKPFEITGDTETGFELRYSTGEVYKGKTEREVLEANARGTADTKLSWRELKHELEEIKEQQARVATALQPPPPQPTPQEVEQSQMDDYIVGAFGRKLGIGSPDEVVSRLRDIEQQSAEGKKRQVIASFFQACPEFPQTEAAAGKIEAWRVANDIPAEKMTLNHLKSAHAYCVQFGEYKPLTQDELNANFQRMGQPQASTVGARAQAPPTLATGQPEMTGTKSLWEMTPQEIQKMYFDQRARGGQ